MSKYIYSQRFGRSKRLSVSVLASLALLFNSVSISLPLLLSRKAAAASTTAVHPTSMNGWVTATTTGGTVNFVASSGTPVGSGAVELKTTADNQSRAAVSLSQNIPLISLTTLGYSTKQVSMGWAEIDAAYRISIDADGDLSTTNDKATLVYEPYWQDEDADSEPIVTNTWQSWNVADGFFWPSISSGNVVTGFANGAGGPPLYTLAQFKSALPNALVTAISTGIGSYNPNSTILVDNLVINDTTYDFEPTPYVPTAPPTRPAVPGAVIFDSIPSVLPSNSPSLGYQATSTKALGDKITFSGTDRDLNKVAVMLSSWACENGEWTSGCTTTPGATFAQPITLNIYEVAGDGSVGSLLASRSQTFAIPYRPTADPSCGAVTQWRDTNTSCFNGRNHVVVFDASGIEVPDTIIYSIAFNTQSYGANPTGSNGAYNSLNTSLTTGPAAVGTNVDADEVFWDTTYPGYTAGLKADSGWASNGNPAVLFTAFQPPATPTNLRYEGPAIACGGLTNINWTTAAWNSVAGAVSYNYEALYNGSVVYSNNFSGTSNTGSFGGGQNGTWGFRVQSVGPTGLTSAWTNVCEITLDTVVPAVPVHEYPSNNALINFNDFWFEWTDVAGVSGYETQYSQNPAVGVDGAFQDVQWTGDYQHIQPTDSRAHSVGASGTWYWQVRAIDAAGNKSAWTSPWKLTIDAEAPAVPTAVFTADNDGDTVTSGGATDSQHFTFTLGSSSDTTRYQLKYWNEVPGSAYQSFNPWSPTDLAGYSPTLGTYKDNFTQGEGKHYFAFSACDAAGNCSAFSAPFEITFDTTAPTASLTFPTPGPSATSFSVTFNEDVNEAEAENAANYFLNNWPGAGGSGDLSGDVSVVYDSATRTATLTMLNTGWYVSPEQQWGVQNIHDLAGNLITPNPTTAYSTPLVAPTTPGTPVATSAANDLNIVWSWDASTDIDGSGVKEYHYTLKQGSTVLTSGTTSSTTVTTPVSGEGTYTLEVYSTDNAGSPQSGTATGSITIDTTAPVLTINPISDSTDTTPTITGTTDEPSLPVVVTVNGTSYNAVVNPDGTWSAEVTTPLAVGAYNVTASSTDTAGNSPAPAPSQSFAVVAAPVTTTSNSGTVAGANNTPAAARTAARTTTNNGTEAEETTAQEQTATPTVLSETDSANDSGTTDTNGEKTEEAKKGCFKILGICWYWWIPVVILVIWLIYYVVRRNTESSDK